MPSNKDVPVLPDTQSKVDKKTQVAEMFNDISMRYDFLNHFLSLGIDRSWRKRAIARAVSSQPSWLLDVATGTGDIALAAAQVSQAQIIGVDIAVQMLEIGQNKIREQNLEQRITFQRGDCEHLEFADHRFDVVTCAFGVRNFARLEKGVAEMYRVLKPEGKLVILEFSEPTQPIFRMVYRSYFRFVLPILGRMFSGHRRAYSYLPESVRSFPQGDQFLNVLRQQGFVNCIDESLTFGITHLYTAHKKTRVGKTHSE